MEEHDIVRFAEGALRACRDVLVNEARIGIWVDGEEVAGLMALPEELEELALGFLYGECAFNDPSDIREVSVNPRLHAVTVALGTKNRPSLPDVVRTFTSGCGRGISRISPYWTGHFPAVRSGACHPAGEILEAVRTLIGSSTLFRDTGGVHSAGLWTGGRFPRTCDDIGRHNAVDKVVGHALREGWPPGEGSLLVTTGRLSSDIVLKAARAGVPVLVSRSAPTAGAVQLAEAQGITLVGFARAGRCNIYTHPERVRES
ncbi:MAG: formate dehydrogenase accessory sulfurtransferase FdhD [Acidobacteria bacterium]|nr:formate dehydrogenase accessory sulfurtransferase FdhD [Acidobacteriota bacterium]